MKRTLCILTALCMLLCSTAFAADNTAEVSVAERKVMTTLYVSPNGSDSALGSENAPLATLEGARRAVRSINGNMTGDIVVKINDGTYFLNKTVEFGVADSGTNGFYVRYMAAEGAHPVISGGKVVSGTWQSEGRGIYSVPLERSKKLRALYVNEKRAYMTSRKIQGRGGNGTYTVTKDQAPWAWIGGSTSAGTKLDKGSIPLDTKNPDDIELQTQTTWNTAIVCVSSLADIGNNQICAYLQMPYAAIAQKPGWNNNYKTGNMQTVFNVFEWLDTPGQFYFDKSAKRLYYYPREDEDMASASVIVPEVETLVNIEGGSLTNRVENIAFEGITFAHTDWNLCKVENSYGRATTQGAACVMNFIEGTAWHKYIYRAYDITPAAFMASSIKGFVFTKNTIHATGNDALSIPNDVTDAIIDGNIIYDTAGTAALIGHPQHMYIGDKGSSKGLASDKEKYDVDVEGACENITFTNNFMRDTSKMFWGDAGIMVFAVKNMLMQYNHLEDTPYSGLSLGWGWWNMDGTSGSIVPGFPTEATRNNKILNNTFAHTIRLLGDAGAIYTLSDMPGTVMNENYIDDIGTRGTTPYHIRGVHIDEGTKHIAGSRNVIEIPTELTCIDCGNWGNKGYNTFDNNYSTSDSYKTTSAYEPGTTMTNKHTSPGGVWGRDVFDILSACGMQSEYIKNIPDFLYNVQDKLLPTKFLLDGGTELDFKVLPSDIESEIWLAPENTVEFKASATVRKISAEGKGKVPTDKGSYRIFIVKSGTASAPSKGEITVSGASLGVNVQHGGSYRVSAAKPLEVELKTAYLKEAKLNGSAVASGAKIKTEGEWQLSTTDLNSKESTITFTTYIEAVDKAFVNSMQAEPQSAVAIQKSDAQAWFAPLDAEITSPSQLTASDTMTAAASGAALIETPKAFGEYVLYLVSGTVVSKPSDAVLTVSSKELTVTDNLIAHFNAQKLTGSSISQWTSEVNGYKLTQSTASKQPRLTEAQTGFKYLDFDGVDDAMSADGIDLNNKSALTIIALSAYKDTDPSTGTYGDTKTTLYFADAADWGSIYISSYGGFVRTRFGSGQSNNYIKYQRAAATSDFTVTAMVKNGTEEYLYEDGVKVVTEKGKYEKTAGSKTSMTIGYTDSGTKGYAKEAVSDILIYDKALSEDEVKKVYNYLNQKMKFTVMDSVIEKAIAMLGDEKISEKYSARSISEIEDAYSAALSLKSAACTIAQVTAATDALQNAMESAMPPFDEIPSNGLNLWLRADRGVITDNNGKVTLWRDSSGAGHNATAANNTQTGESVTAPTFKESAYNSKPTISFNGAGDGMQFPFEGINGASAGSVIIVCANKASNSDASSANSYPLLYFHESGSWGKFIVTPAQSLITARFGSAASSDSGGVLRYTRPTDIGEALSVTAVVKDGTTNTIYVGDSVAISSENGKATFVNVDDSIGYIGRYPNGTDKTLWYNKSDVAEIMIYDRALGLAEIQAINNYVQEKYFTAHTEGASIESVNYGADNATVKVNISKINKAAMVAAAIFDTEGTLCGSGVALAAASDESCIVKVSTKSALKPYSISAFVWDKDTLMPLAQRMDKNA